MENKIPRGIKIVAVYYIFLGLTSLLLPDKSPFSMFMGQMYKRDDLFVLFVFLALIRIICGYGLWIRNLLIWKITLLFNAFLVFGDLANLVFSSVKMTARTYFTISIIFHVVIVVFISVYLFKFKRYFHRCDEAK